MSKPLIAPFLQRLLKPFIGLLALLLVFEEWLWELPKAQLHRLSALPAVRMMEQRLQTLPPWASVLVLVVPALVLLPFKLVGLWALAHGHLCMAIYSWG